MPAPAQAGRRLSWDPVRVSMQTGSGGCCPRCPVVERTGCPFVPRGRLHKVLSRPVCLAQTISDKRSRGRVHRQASLGRLCQKPPKNHPLLATVLHAFCLDCVVFT